MKKQVITMLKKIGVQVKRYPDHDLARRIKMVNYYNINTVFDIGANTGQYAAILRELGYKERIISFEPLQSAYKKLKFNSSSDENWVVNNYAIGDTDSRSVINVANNSVSSSILNMLPMHINSANDSKYVGQEEIEIRKLDSIFSSFCTKEDRVMVKIDTQGYEKNVLDGAVKTLSNIKIIQLEMSLVPLYENEILFFNMASYLESKGFQLFSLENGFSEPITGQLLQVDGLFVQGIDSKLKRND